MTLPVGLRSVLWWDQLPADLTTPVGEPMSGDTEADVAIVGAGFTGLWTAYYLLKRLPGIRITIVEAQVAGFGASGRNGGWASALFPVDDAVIARRFGVPAALAMRTALNEAVDEIGRVAQQHHWPIDWAKGGTVVAARTAAQLHAMHVKADTEAALGLPRDDRLLNQDETRSIMNATDVLGGVYTPHCASIQPAILVRSLATEVVRQGVTIYEHTPALGIEPGVVRTASGDVRARFIIRATEGYTPSLAGERRTVVPVYSLMIATEPLPDATWDEIGLTDRPTFSDGRHLIIYGQRTADGRIAFGGRGAPYRFGSRLDLRSELDGSIHRMLARSLVDMFPVLARHRITHAWGGALGITRDWWASVGLDPKTGLGWSGGYVGDGVTTSNLGARTLAALIAGASDVPDLPWINLRSRPWEPEPLRWAGITLSRYAMSSADEFEARSDRPARRARILNLVTGH